VIGFEQELSGGSIRSYPDRHWVNPLNNIIPRAPQNAVGISWKYLAAGNLDLDGSTEIYLAPNVPEGRQSNWLVFSQG